MQRGKKTHRRAKTAATSTKGSHASSSLSHSNLQSLSSSTSLNSSPSRSITISTSISRTHSSSRLNPSKSSSSYNTRKNTSTYISSSSPFSISQLSMSTQPKDKADMMKQIDDRVNGRPYGADKLITSKGAQISTDGTSVVITSSAMEYKLHDSVEKAGNALRVHFITEGQIKAGLPALEQVSNDIDWNVAQPLLTAQHFKGKSGNTATVVTKTGTPVVLSGIGDVIDGYSSSTKHYKLSAYRQAVHKIAKHVKGLEFDALNIVLPSIPLTTADDVEYGAGKGITKKEDDEKNKEKEKKPATEMKPHPTDPVSVTTLATDTIRFVTLANHAFDKYVNAESAKEKNPLLKHLHITTPLAGEITATHLANVVNLAESEIYAREVGNERSNVATNSFIEAQCRALVDANPDVLKLRVLGREELEAEGYNLMLAVGQGSVDPPRIISIEYTPPTEGELGESIGIVGKTLTFDTGGHCLKVPSNYMLDMYMDKLGGVNTLSILRTLALNKPALSSKVVGVLAVADNAIGSKAIHPRVIIDTRSGQSVTIEDTDAEGRLVLADALQYVQDHHKVSKVIDMATLTGSIMVALGTHAAGVFSNSNKFAQEIIAAGSQTNEMYWHMPIFPQHFKALEADDCDILNCSRGKYSDASNAAAFLTSFIQPGVAYAHLDVAGVASLDSATDHLPAGATAFGVSSIYHYVTKQ